MQNQPQVFKYDSNDNLLQYQELDPKGNVEFECELSGHVYTKHFVDQGKFEITIFKEKVKLDCVISAGETWVRPIKSGINKFEVPTKDFFMSIDKGFIKHFKLDEDVFKILAHKAGE